VGEKMSATSSPLKGEVARLGCHLAFNDMPFKPMRCHYAEKAGCTINAETHSQSVLPC
jgi:hypothetical protein